LTKNETEAALSKVNGFMAYVTTTSVRYHNE